MSKDYGIAQFYQAARLTDTTVLIVAVGQAPNLNTQVTIEQLPWRIFPPQFGLFFDTPAISLPALRPFVVSAVFPYPKDIDMLRIVDATGAHKLEIFSAFPFSAVERERHLQGQKEFNAYQQIGVANCMIAPEGAMVPMIYTKAFGPAAYAECEAWIAKNCGAI